MLISNLFQNNQWSGPQRPQIEAFPPSRRTSWFIFNFPLASVSKDGGKISFQPQVNLSSEGSGVADPPLILSYGLMFRTLHSGQSRLKGRPDSTATTWLKYQKWWHIYCSVSFILGQILLGNVLVRFCSHFYPNLCRTQIIFGYCKKKIPAYSNTHQSRVDWSLPGLCTLRSFGCDFIWRQGRYVSHQVKMWSFG